MIVTPDFVFLHLHKSGGTFVIRLLRDFIPGARAVGYHLPRQYIPAAYDDLPILGTVRNPWAYYVSWFSFQAAMVRPNPLFQACSEDRRLGFDGTIRNLLTLGDQPERLDRVVSQLPTAFPNRGINLTGKCLAPLAGSSLGFYSFLYQRMYGDRSRTTLVDTARLRPGLFDFLGHVGTHVDQPMRDAILHEAPANTSRHDHYSGYYDQELRDLVAARDAEIIDRHGYRFEARS